MASLFLAEFDTGASGFSKLAVFYDNHRIVTGAPLATIYDSSRADDSQKVSLAFYIEDLQAVPGLNLYVADLHRLFLQQFMENQTQTWVNSGHGPELAANKAILHATPQVLEA